MHFGGFSVHNNLFVQCMSASLICRRGFYANSKIPGSQRNVVNIRCRIVRSLKTGAPWSEGWSGSLLSYQTDGQSNLRSPRAKNCVYLWWNKRRYILNKKYIPTVIKIYVQKKGKWDFIAQKWLIIKIRNLLFTMCVVYFSVFCVCVLVHRKKYIFIPSWGQGLINIIKNKIIKNINIYIHIYIYMNMYHYKESNG